ncbi:hypothetical protein TNCV_4837851 [Trichonephila clavipes]|nr:hypothetical protein TNCV_4837851 [Trichonephila clavipes]
MGDNKKHGNRKKEAFSLETKMQVIRRLDTGERQLQTGAALNLTTSPIRTILKNKEKILSPTTATTTSSAARITRSRNNKIEEIEKKTFHIETDDEIERNMPLKQDLKFYLFLYAYSFIIFLYLSECITIRRGLQFAWETEVQSQDVWILTNSHASIQQLSKWTSIGYLTSLDILNLLGRISSTHHPFFQWIPIHVGLMIISNQNS